MIKRTLSALILITFITTVIMPPGYAQSVTLPTPGVMVNPSVAYVPALLRGMTLHKDNPFQFDFIVDNGQSGLQGEALKKESQRLVKYFLASMTVPQNDLWVNLSPAEKNRIVPDALGKTELGQDLLAQDYILKQLTATLMYPEAELGKKFWDRIYKEAKEKYGVTDIPTDTFNKVWILPESATIYENGATVYVVDAKLKVMLDQDYQAISKTVGAGSPRPDDDGRGNRAPTKIIKEVILPAIEKEVNTGKNFAPLRQIYHSLILAKWYKEKVRNSILSSAYINQNKVSGIDENNPKAKEEIYAQYMEAYKKGVYNYMKEEYDPKTQQITPKKYFSGGFKDQAMTINRTNEIKIVEASVVGSNYTISLRIDPQKKHGDSAMSSKQKSASAIPVVLLVGKPGAGKTKIGMQISKKLGPNVFHLSMGEFIRSQMPHKTPLTHEQRRDIYKRLTEYLKTKPHISLFLFDNNPYGSDSYDALQDFLNQGNFELVKVINIDVTDEAALSRQESRGRIDSMGVSFQNRLNYYNNNLQKNVPDQIKKFAQEGLVQNIDNNENDKGKSALVTLFEALSPLALEGCERLVRRMIPQLQALIASEQAVVVNELAQEIMKEGLSKLEERLALKYPDVLKENLLVLEAEHIIADLKKPADHAMTSDVKALLESAKIADNSTLKKIYDELNKMPNGAARAIYDILYKTTSMDLVEANDLVEASKIAAKEFFTGFQNWMNTKGQDPKKKFILMFATGKSPEMAYKFIEDYLHQDWTNADVRKGLIAQGIDPDRKPDMTRVISFHLDTIIAQKRGEYFAFSNIVNKWDDSFGIPKDQRNFFHGDVILSDDGKSVRQMTEEEFSKLRQDIQKNGLKVKDYVAGKLDKEKFGVQYAFFEALKLQNKIMTEKLKSLGGADIVFGSTGPANDGSGHIAFVESESLDEMEAFIAEANHHILAGQASQGRGYQSLMGKTGIASFSLSDITQNKDAKLIMIVLDNKKRTTVKEAIEGNNMAMPVGALRNAKGVFIVDKGSAEDLLINKYPWDFRLIDESGWTDSLRKDFFVRVALRSGKKVKDLTREDFLNFEQDKTHPLILWARRQNLNVLLKKEGFDKQKMRVAVETKSNTILTENLAEKLWGQDYVNEFEAAKKHLSDLEKKARQSTEDLSSQINEARREVRRLKKTIIAFDPHPDDRFLADPNAYRHLIAQGHRVIAIMATPGLSGVGDAFTLSILSHILSWDEEKFNAAKNTDRKTLSQKLLQVAQQRNFEKQNLPDYEIWSRMTFEEKDLRAGLLLNYLANKIYPTLTDSDKQMCPQGFETVADFKQFFNIIKNVIDARQDWGSASVKIMDEIKSAIRVIEEKTAMLSWGIAYEDIYDPIKPSWYSSVGRLGTASQKDIEKFIALLKQAGQLDEGGRIDAVFGNGEGFSDWEAHASTEATMIASLFALDNEGLLDHKTFRYMTYAGVWERIRTEQSNLTIAYSKKEKENLHTKFSQLYPSQSPNMAPDASYDRLMLFPQSVELNGIATKEEILSLIDPDDEIAKILIEGGMALNFRIHDFFDPATREFLKTKVTELERLRDDLKRTSAPALYGKPPLPSVLTRREKEKNAILEKIYPKPDDPWTQLEGVNDRYWEKFAGEFEKAKVADTFPVDFLNKILRKVIKDAPVLEIAAGSGRAMVQMRDQGYDNITGLDISAEAREMALKKGFAPDKFLVSNIKKDEINGTYDAIVANDIFLYFTPRELDLVMRKIQNALKPGGRLGFRWAAQNEKQPPFKRKDKGTEKDRWVVHASQQMLKDILALYGFNLVEEPKIIPEPIYGGNAFVDYWYVVAEKTSDAALITDKKVGGIDMNNINLKGNDKGVFQFDPSIMKKFEDMDIDGFVPVIIELTPVTSILPLLGLSAQKEEKVALSHR
ncbi:MAG: nucleoside monophosphate kinase [Candidatus Omnitrophica bacterium]|nr:nucleoside monophosphate kinase [Candidatus Omnitrophota bacterium]